MSAIPQHGAMSVGRIRHIMTYAARMCQNVYGDDSSLQSNGLRQHAMVRQRKANVTISDEVIEKGSTETAWSDMEVQILEAARHLIAEEGYPNFSMRTIASHSGIHLKSLQYYFKTKREMLNSVVNYTIEHYYFDIYGKLFEEGAVSDPRERFSLMIDYLLNDLSDPFTGKLFPELWALATRDDDLRAAMDIFYLRHLQSLERAIRDINPLLDKETGKHRAALIGMMIEGLVLILGHGKPRHPQYKNLKRAAKNTILHIAMAPSDLPSADIPSARNGKLSAPAKKR